MAIFLIIAFVLILFIFIFYKKFKTIKSNSVLFISGAPKTGKSLLSVYLCFQKIKKNQLKWLLKDCILKTFSFSKLHNVSDFPLLYSNIPLAYDLGYIPLTKELITRQVYINNKSVVYLGEFSLVANSRLGQNNGIKNGVDYDLINEQLLLFTKLCGHQFNGFVVVDSQTIGDCHYSIKRVLSNYIYIHSNFRFLFWQVLRVQELLYSDDNSTINMNDSSEDIVRKLKYIVISRKFFKNYDYRCYSVLTDDLPKKYNLISKTDNLKADNIVSYTTFKTLKKGVNKND